MRPNGGSTFYSEAASDGQARAHNDHPADRGRRPPRDGAPAGGAGGRGRRRRPVHRRGDRAPAPRIGRATVFRTLKLLVELDIFCRVLLDDGELHYRWSRRGHHHHLVCTDCGAVDDFTACVVSGLVEEQTRRTNFTVEGHWLEVYGRCGACATKLTAPVASTRAA
jgi:Fe2+ or Zn2+ uptake regulation protein